MLTSLITIALAIVAAFVAMIALFWWRQESIVFQPPGVLAEREHEPLRVEYQARDGQPLCGYLVRASTSDSSTSDSRRVLIAFHGNAELAAWQVPWGEEVARRTGWGVLLAEYRGYGGLGGAPTYAGSQLDALAAMSYATDVLGVSADHTALFGHSLGTAIATELAARVGPRVLILQSPFTSARDMARFLVPRSAHAAWRLISRVHYDTKTCVASLDCPVWVAHGERDLVIPTRMGRTVFEAARVKGELLLVPRAGHNDVEMLGGEKYWGWLERALTST